MTDQPNETFCPLYREAIASKPNQRLSTGHSGLRFDKFGQAWRWKRDKLGKIEKPQVPEFDKGAGVKKDGANQWLNSFASDQLGHGDKEQLAEACHRQRELIKSLGGRVMYITNESRFVTGMGRQHPLEIGFSWHHTLGTPFLSATGLKGMFRSWFCEENGHWDNSDSRRQPKWIANDKEKEDDLHRVFGDQSKIGDLIFFDVLPLAPVQLVAEIMTPHYGPYYQDGKVPGDWHSPIPITYLAVETGMSWQYGIAPRKPGAMTEELEYLVKCLNEGLTWLGVGAKTSIGMGRFVEDAATQCKIIEREQRHDEDRIKQLELANETAAFNASLEQNSQELRELKTAERDENWQRSAADTNMTLALSQFAEKHSKLPQDCLEWLKEFFESIPNYKGVWNAPDTKTGKKTDKDKYSKSIRELVKKLNPDL